MSKKIIKLSFCTINILNILIIIYLIVFNKNINDPLLSYKLASGKDYQITKLNYYLISIGIVVFYSIFNIKDYLKEKKINLNLLIAYILFMIFILILPYVM